MFIGRQQITFFDTGNNVEVVADTARRACHFRLESPLEKPEERDDCREKNLLSDARQNRLRHLGEALTIIRGVLASGSA